MPLLLLHDGPGLGDRCLQLPIVPLNLALRRLHQLDAEREPEDAADPEVLGDGPAIRGDLLLRVRPPLLVVPQLVGGDVLQDLPVLRRLDRLGQPAVDMVLGDLISLKPQEPLPHFLADAHSLASFAKCSQAWVRMIYASVRRASSDGKNLLARKREARHARAHSPSTNDGSRKGFYSTFVTPGVAIG